MYWLSITLPNDRSGHRGSAQAISLNLPSTPQAWLDLVAAIAEGEAEYRAALKTKLRSCPSMLLFALAEYYLSTGHPASCPRVLTDWCRHHLLKSAIDRGSQPASQTRAVLKLDPTFWKAFLKPGKRKTFKSSLKAWLKHQANLVAYERKQFLNSILIGAFLPDQFGQQQMSTKMNRDMIAASWERNSVSDVPLKKILKLAEASLLQESEFRRRLWHEKLAAARELAYGASHEINNPLANIAMRAQALIVNEQHPENQRRLAVIYQQAMRAHEMISDMMLFAKPPKLVRAHVSLRLKMRDFLRRWDKQLEESNIQLNVRFANRDDVVNVDIDQLMAAMNCLVKNSAEAIVGKPNASPEIDIRIEVLETAVEITVSDNGVGISENVEPHLFDPFYSGREAGRGLGFGLSKVWTIVQAHGGVVKHFHDSGKTHFVICLPREAEHVIDPIDRPKTVGGDSDQDTPAALRIA